VVARAIAPEVLPPLAELDAASRSSCGVFRDAPDPDGAGVSGLKDATEETGRTEYWRDPFDRDRAAWRGDPSQNDHIRPIPAASSASSYCSVWRRSHR